MTRTDPIPPYRPVETKVLTVDPRQPGPEVIAHAADILRSGGLVAFPTETVYGLGARADDAAAIARIYAAKERPAANPLIAHVPDAAAAVALTDAWPRAATLLAQAFWPGPLTLVMPRAPGIPASLSAGLPTVAVRAPANAIAQALLRAVGLPVAAPSANLSQRLSPTTADHVLRGLQGRVDLILDGGPCRHGIESTVVDLCVDPPRILRPGVLSATVLRIVLPTLLDGTVDPVDVHTPRSAPGLDARHYAPRAKLSLVPRTLLQAHAAIAGRPLGVLTLAVPLSAVDVLECTLPADPEQYGASLFATLHGFDGAGVRTILVEEVPETPEWAGIRDRLQRAAW